MFSYPQKQALFSPFCKKIFVEVILSANKKRSPVDLTSTGLLLLNIY